MGRALPARPESVLTAVERLGVLQFDPLEVPGARNQDLPVQTFILLKSAPARVVVNPPSKRVTSKDSRARQVYSENL